MAYIIVPVVAILWLAPVAGIAVALFTEGRQ
jgi:hypothetical protein